MEEVRVDNNAEWQQNLEQVFSVLERAQGAEYEQAVRQLSLLACVALKTGREQEAEECFIKLLSIAADKLSTVCYLASIKNILVMAARMRREELFTRWLEAAKTQVCLLMHAGEKQSSADFILALVFIACDRRFLSALRALRSIVEQFLRSCGDEKVLQAFLGEWTSLLAQFARRRWREVNSFLLRILLKALLLQKDLRLLQLVLLQLNMHLQMYSRWDSFANAFTVYGELQYFYLLLLKRTGNHRFTEAERRRYLLLTLRSIRDWVANVARTNMQDDLEILRAWQQLLKVNISSRLQMWVDILVQLEINYWHLTKPRTSRKQLEYLTDLLEPDVIPQEQRDMLNELV